MKTSEIPLIFINFNDDVSGVGARELELGQFVIGLSSASVVPLVSLREQFRNVWLA